MIEVETARKLARFLAYWEGLIDHVPREEHHNFISAWYKRPADTCAYTRGKMAQLSTNPSAWINSLDNGNLKRLLDHLTTPQEGGTSTC